MATAKKSAAIPADRLDDTTLDRLSAAQFIDSLRGRGAVELLPYWPEKKKYELEVEPTVVGRLRLKDFLEILEKFKGEKKKAEYELPDILREPFSPEPVPWRERQIATRLDALTTKLNDLTEKVERISR